jgi:antitoxin HigA-1
MIISFRRQLAEDLFLGRETAVTRRFPRELHATANRKLQYLNSAARLDDLRVPPGNRLELLRGDLAGRYSIRINDRWRIVFRWEEGAKDVEIADYHWQGTQMRPANPIHPGQMLLEEFLQPLGMSQRRFAAQIGWTPARLNEVVLGKRGITADAALDLAHQLGTSPELWLNLQMYHDLAAAEARRTRVS